MSSPTAEEQLMLELVNRFRMDPTGELDRLTGPGAQASVRGAIAEFGTDMQVVRRQMESLAALAPLAWNDRLSAAAESHNAAMIASATQAHQVAGEPDLRARATAAGYKYSAIGENVYAYVDDVIHGHAAYVIDWGRDAEDYANGVLRPDWSQVGDGILDGAGHRTNLLSTSIDEIGIAIDHTGRSGLGPLVNTQDLATRADYKAQFVGVAFDDLDGDAFYDVGEGLGGVLVTLRQGDLVFTTSTWEAGGWQAEVAAGTWEVTFSGGGLTAPVTQVATLGRDNVKLDVIAPHQPYVPPAQPEPELPSEVLKHDFSVSPDWDMMLF